MKTITKWKSCALWPFDAGIHENPSTDNHETLTAARAVCDMLEIDGFGGENRVFPLYVWVEPVVEDIPKIY